MVKLLITVLNMSISASLVILAVWLLRFFLKRLPRVFAYILWIVVFLRLVWPFWPETQWGIIPNIGLVEAGAGSDIWVLGDLESRVEGLRFTYEEALNDQQMLKQQGAKQDEKEGQHPAEAEGKEHMADKAGEILLRIRQVWSWASVVYLTVCSILLLYGAYSYALFWKRLKNSVKRESADYSVERMWGYGKSCRIVVLENVEEPFVWGLLKPVIYLPKGLSKEQQELVIQHEMMHILRWDYLIKPLAFLAVCVHWFNPLVWVAFHFMERDMEISCDEAVLKKVGYENKKAYADTLLCLSGERKWRPGCPIAFGEKSVIARIKNTVKLKQTKTWAAVVGAIGVLVVAALLLVDGNWNLALVSKEAGAESLAALPTDANDAESEGKEITGIDSNTETEYLYQEELSGELTNVQIAEEMYLPTEKIAHTERIPEDGSGTTDHYYYVVTEPDNYSVLLRQSEEPYQESAIQYSIPVEDARISDGYGTRVHPVSKEVRLHSGVDFAADKGTPVKAAAQGTVFETGTDVNCGNYVIIRHDNGDMTYYANCDEIMAETGQRVEQGEEIATVGNTGLSTGPHLHYALSRNGSFVEPEFVMP